MSRTRNLHCSLLALCCFACSSESDHNDAIATPADLETTATASGPAGAVTGAEPIAPIAPPTGSSTASAVPNPMSPTTGGNVPPVNPSATAEPVPSADNPAASTTETSESTGGSLSNPMVGGSGGTAGEGGEDTTDPEASAGGSSTSATGGQAGAASSAGAGTGGTATEGTGGSAESPCEEQGQVQGSEVLLIGDSFIALNHSITNSLQEIARAAGALDPGETYREAAVSGTTLANNQISSQYEDSVNSSPVKVVLMDGGGNDCLLNNNGDAALSAAESLFQTMQENGTETVVYFFYPDPLGSFASGSLKGCLDALRPQMQELCESLTSPRCYFLDLRPTWDGHDEYTTDGIHPTEEGGAATAAAIWETLQSHCIAQ